MNYLEFRANTRNLLSLIDEKANLLSFEARSDRDLISGILFDICHDHAKAIVVTLENHLYASAYALVRSLFECFVRAAWIKHCACKRDIDYVIKKDEFKLTFGEMLDAVERNREWAKTLSQVKNAAWKAMHSYTHGGMQLISRRFSDNFIEHKVDEQEIIGILQFVALIAFLSFNEMIAMSIGSETKNKDLNDMLDGLLQWCFTAEVGK